VGGFVRKTVFYCSSPADLRRDLLNYKKSSGVNQATNKVSPWVKASGLSFTRLKKSRLLAFTLFFITLFSLTTILIPASAVRADDGLASNSPARVANTDGDGVRFREAPNTGAATITIIPENELVTIKGGQTKDSEGNSFYKVQYQDKTGYAMSQYLIFAGKANPGVAAIPVGNPAKIVNTDGDGVNFRQQANSASSVMAVLTENTLVTSLGGPFTDKENNSFFRVDYKGTTGFVSVAYVGSAPANAITSGGGGNLKVTNTDGDPVRFRSGPGRTFDQVGLVYEGQVVKELGGAVKDDDGGKWFRIEAGGKVGYVIGTYVAATSDAPGTPAAPAKTVAPAPVATKAPAKTAAPAPVVTKAPAKVESVASNTSKGEQLVAFAKKYLGWRYVWGGKSPSAGGFDCSGFVYWVLTQNGISAGSSAAGDLSVGTPVSAGNLQPGDVLIWSNTYMPGPSHVGIYIGGGQFIHAENYSTGVTITSVNSAYYASRFTAARRP
jgi:cell wall-associated NlpC family hydrolase